MFTAKVVDKSLVCGKTQDVNWASATINGDSKNIVAKDDASVFLTKSCPGPDPTPTPTPPEPTPTPTPTPPEYPKTGATEVVVSALGIGATKLTASLGRETSKSSLGFGLGGFLLWYNSLVERG